MKPVLLRVISQRKSIGDWSDLLFIFEDLFECMRILYITEIILHREMLYLSRISMQLHRRRCTPEEREEAYRQKEQPIDNAMHALLL
jgi:hypothetical protein